MGLGSFVHPSLLAGLGLIALPILIHLLQRLRYRRVPFAAMEFLRDSQRRHRRRRWWEQLLLLLMRCALVALIVLVVARPHAPGAWARILGSGGTTRHVVLWDDSASMGAKTEESTRFDLARERIEQTLSELARSSGEHRVTLYRSSRPDAPLLDNAVIDEALLGRLPRLLSAEKVGSLAKSPARALVEKENGWFSADRPGVLHIVSDLSANDWPAAGDWVSTFRRLYEQGTTLRFLDVGTEAAGNVSVMNVSVDETPSAGVPFTARAEIKNRSRDARERLALKPRWNGEALPAQMIERLAPGESRTVTIPLVAALPALNELTVEIDDDALTVDNTRYLAIDVPSAVPVLIVDESAGRRDSMYLSLALAPGEEAPTGVAPEIRSSADLASLDLARYRAVFLLDIPTLSAESARLLTSFAKQGGGVALFMGPNVDIGSYRTSAGSLAPWSLAGRRSIEAQSRPVDGDLRVEDHPIFSLFQGERNSYLKTVTVHELMSIDESTLPPTSKVVARHRDGSPLIIDSPLDRGRVVTFLTTAGDAWTTWPQNPTYVITMLSLERYLARSAPTRSERLCGEPWKLEWELATFGSDVEVVRPSQFKQEPIKDNVRAVVDGSRASLTWTETEQPGIYRVVRSRIDGTRVTETSSFNIDPQEGDLTRRSRASLEKELEGIPVEWVDADDGASIRSARTEVKDGLLALLALLFVAEQWTSYRLGYHRSEVSTSLRSRRDEVTIP